MTFDSHIKAFDVVVLLLPLTLGSLLVTQTFVSFWQVLCQAVGSANVAVHKHTQPHENVYSADRMLPHTNTHRLHHRLRELACKIDHDSWLGAPPSLEDQYILQSDCFPALPTPSLVWLIILCLCFGPSISRIFNARVGGELDLYNKIYVCFAIYQAKIYQYSLSTFSPKALKWSSMDWVGMGRNERLDLVK